jgi:serine/threonine protein kinase
MFYRYVVSLLGICTKEPNIALVMELMTGGTLAHLLHSKTELPWANRLDIVEDIVKGVHRLHSNNPQVC